MDIAKNTTRHVARKAINKIEKKQNFYNLLPAHIAGFQIITLI